MKEVIEVEVDGKKYKVYIREVTYGEFQEIARKATKFIGKQMQVDQTVLENGLLEKAIEKVEPDVGNVVEWIKSLPIRVAIKIVQKVLEVNPFLVE